MDWGILIASKVVENEPVKEWECDESCKNAIAVILEEERIAREAEEAKKKAEARGIVYLTFDDGPGEYTNALLDTLEKYKIKATFFVTGRGEDDAIKREYDEGHAIGLHTWSHDYAYIYTNTNNYFADLTQIADRVKRITNEDSKLLRFPGGSSNLVSRRYDGRTKIMSTLTKEVTARGYQYFDWNVDSDDAGRASTPDAVYNNVISHLKDGPNVVLQHDIKPYSVEAVENIIKYGLENNFYFDKLDLNSFAAHHGINN